tara:strand:+ start:206 stop:427 length:222 start_codon:yes stop_codon:yes gene_type:complete
MQQVNKNYKAYEDKDFIECCQLACINPGDCDAEQRLIDHYTTTIWHLERHVRDRLLEEFCDQIHAQDIEGGEL